MKILVVDDEAPARARLCRILEGLEDCVVSGEAASGREALQLTASLQPDVLLLDIRMPGMDGLEAVQHLQSLQQPPAVIFTTAFNDYAVQAFETHAVDYLLKPVRRERLQRALERVRRSPAPSPAQLAGRQRAPVSRRVVAELKRRLGIGAG